MLVWPTLCALVPPLYTLFVLTLLVLAKDLIGHGSILGLHRVRLEGPGS